MGDYDYGPAVQPFTPERRGLERRSMPPAIRSVYRDLQTYARAFGAVSDGVEWVAVPKVLLQAAADSLRNSWRRED